MTLTLCLGRAPAYVIEKFNEFKSIYSSITAAMFSLLEKDHLLKQKYRFYQSDGKYEEWEIMGTTDDTEDSLQQVASRLDAYVQYSRLDSRAAAIEELLLSPGGRQGRNSDGETSADENTLVDISTNNIDEELDDVCMDFADGNMVDDGSKERKKKRKSRKPKKHKKKYEEDSPEEDEGKKKRSARDVWRRVGSKFIGWYVCILCNKKQKNEEEYRRHIEMHGEAHSPACMDCGNYFESMVEYEAHIGNMGKELIYRCEEQGCGKAFQFKCRLKCHQRTHIGELMYKCNDCGHKLSSIRSIIRHTRAKHLNERPFNCHMCDKAFAIQSQLTRHIKDHISPPHYTCEHCGRTFSSRQGHHYHQLDHLGVKPHKCSVCGKAFRNKTDMINHERIHSGDRPFTCELCGKSFVEKGALRKHRVVHTREKNYVCSNCGKQFGYKCSLDGHLKKCQQDLHTNSHALLSIVPQRQHALTPQHDKPLQIVEDTPTTTQGNMVSATSSQESSRGRNMYAGSLPDFTSNPHDSIAKDRNSLPPNNEDLLATAVLKGQQEASRLMKKNQAYRPLPNLGQNVNKHMQDAQMYPGYPMQLSHQRETIDADILATVLGQKLPLPMEAMQQYGNDRAPRDDSHAAHFRALAQQERDPSHVMDGPAPSGPVSASYNPLRHPQHPPSTIGDSMMFPQARSHHFRP